jgi:hypothetical protein
MKKVLSLAVILTLLCFTGSGFCSMSGGIIGAVGGGVASSVVAVGVGTAVGGVLAFVAAPAAGVAVAFSGALNVVLTHIWGIGITGLIAGAIEGARGGHPLIAGVYAGAGAGVFVR